jgi:hypothetical protein
MSGMIQIFTLPGDQIRNIPFVDQRIYISDLLAGSYFIMLDLERDRILKKKIIKE